jgi:SAM-dependent methyltransferase
MSRIPLRYYVGYSLVLVSRLFFSVLENLFHSVPEKLFWVASLPQRFSVIIWTPREIDRYSRTEWNGWQQVWHYARQDNWLNAMERALVETYLSKNGELLNLACGAGREALLLARRGLRVTACDWSPRMIADARRRAQDANLPVLLAVADLMCDLPYRKQAFDYLLLTNIAYSYIYPRWRRVRFLRQAHSILKHGGVFIISFTPARGNPGIPAGLSEWLFMRLRRWPPLNREYEPGDCFADTFIHFFRSEELCQEFQEAQFIIKDWLWDQGYAVLVKP